MPLQNQYITNRKQQRLVLHGQTFLPEELERLLQLENAATAGGLHELYHFLQQWFDPDPWLTVHTSGSTGTPKPIQVEKEHMVQSACMTCNYFNLQPGNTALLCMPLQYIAGKMMVVRALVGQLDLQLVPASGHPFAVATQPADFVAMVPLQVYNTLQVAPERELLAACKTLIIGGGPVDASLEKELQQLPVHAYVTYGMTETLSHIAVRRVNGPEASPYYTPFETVRLALTREDTLLIEAPQVTSAPVYTNDIAELLPDGRFLITGRKDNTINSGGIKIQAEQLEAIVKPYISGAFAITWATDPRFGQAVVLLVTLPEDIVTLAEKLRAVLPVYQQPKHIFPIQEIPHTGSGKINRAACREMAGALYKAAVFTK